MKGLLQRTGAAALDGWDATKEFVTLLYRSVARVRGYRPPGEVARQMFQVGNRSLLFVCVTLGFLGMVLVFQTCLQVGRITGDLSQIGAEFLKASVHELGPTLTGMMLATRVGAGIAAEVGSMKVTEQVDALRMCGVEPIEYLIVPRLLAAVVMTPVLTAFGILSALGLGGLTARIYFSVNPNVFYDVGRVRFPDLVVGFSKCIAYGIAIPIVSAFFGLRARGGSEGVGQATTRAVIGASFAVIVLDFVLSAAGYYFLQSGDAMN
jgi:phospholipid/cholesterol/gamma-HCH transport system permease protein